jgi:hypothetical protein
MFHVLANGRAPIGRSTPARPRRSIGRSIGRASAMWAIGALLLLSPLSVIASASSCSPAKPCAAANGHATNGGTSSNGKDHTSSTKDAQQTGTKQNSGKHNGAENSGKPNGSKQSSGKPNGTKQSSGKHLGSTSTHQASHHPGSTGQHHHAAGAGHGSGGTIGQSSGNGVSSSPQAAIGRVNPSVHHVQAERGGVGQGEQGKEASGVMSVPSSRALMGQRLSASRPIEHVADALRFPAALLGVILLFLALQQRADRRDQMLSRAPVGSRQETLEFR